MRWAERVFTLLLLLLPGPFRERHGDAMRDAFVLALAERRAKGSLATAAFLLSTATDLVATAARIRSVRGRTGKLDGRDLRRSSRIGVVSWIDVKLGLRLLVRHPGLTLVSTFALAVGIPVGLAPGHFADGILAPLPVPEGEDVRLLSLWSPAGGQVAPSTHQHYRMWRDALTSFEDLAAFREVRYNLDADDGLGPADWGAEVTASAFQILRVPPLLGRWIQPADEIQGAPDVAVIGYGLWQRRLNGDPTIVGRTIRLGDRPHTVVGVMPEGFLFPRRQGVWTALRESQAVGERAAEVHVIGRLASGVSIDEARAEFTLVGARPVDAGDGERVVPTVNPYGHLVLPGLAGGIRGTPEFLGFQSLAFVILLVACANVGMLLYARTAARAGELAVRTALGASRARIIAQVFVESLLLAIIASGAGLALMAGAFRLMEMLIPAEWLLALPYWIDWGIGIDTAVGAMGLAMVSAVIAGVVPVLRLTGRAVHSNIRRARARRTGVRFGGLPGAFIVADVAVAVAVLGFALTASDVLERAGTDPATVGIAADEFLAATIRLPSGPNSEAGEEAREEHVRRLGAAQESLVERVRAEPGVRAVIVGDALPRMDHRSRLVAVEGWDPPEGRRGTSSRVARVSPDFFESAGRPILAGRDFEPADLDGDRSVVIVNTTFVQRVLGGENPVGQRLRFIPWGDGEPGPWKEVVGVVGHLGMRVVSAENDQGVYEPLRPGEVETVHLGIRVGEDPTSFAPRLRALAAEVDPGLVVSVRGSLAEVYEGDWYLLMAAGLGAGLLICVLLSLAASGIYAIMSFAVAQRTTEIGIRAALGASRAALINVVAKRAFIQLGLGVLLGTPLAGAIILGDTASRNAGGVVRTLLAGVAVAVVVGIFACVGPVRRALRIHPSEALRSGG